MVFMTKECAHITMSVLHHNMQTREKRDITFKHRNSFSVFSFTPWLRVAKKR